MGGGGDRKNEEVWQKVAERSRISHKLASEAKFIYYNSRVAYQLPVYMDCITST